LAKIQKPATANEINWEELRAQVRGCVQARLDRAHPTDIDEICQRALVGILRTSRRETIANPSGLATIAAERAIKDWLRARRRWWAHHPELNAYDAVQIDDEPLPSEEFGDPLERVRFVVLEFFRINHARCRELAEPYFESSDWNEVAARLQCTPEAIRKRWSRCIAVLRASLKGDLAPLFAVLRGRDE
jgi:DNA-directed RNA polymerase specialized sigma24 family protein